MRHPVVQEDLKLIVDTPYLPWSKIYGKTVLVTGANGFLAAYMIETLLYINELELGDPIRVIGLVRNQQRALERFAHYAGRHDLVFVVQDVVEPVKIDRVVNYVIHAASQASPKYYGKDPVGTLLPNVLGTHNLLTLAQGHAVESLLFFSSGEVYGQVDDAKIPTQESWYGYLDPTDVRSCYGESKRMGETMCVSWFHQFNVPVKIVRPFHTYGPGMRLDDGRVFADFVADILAGRDILMKSDGSATRAFCYLADATLGFFTVLFKGENGQAYNIGNDRGEVSILHLAQILVALFPEKGIRVVPHEVAPNAGYLKSSFTRSCPDISKARQLGWEPRTSIEVGFERTISSFL